MPSPYLEAALAKLGRTRSAASDRAVAREVNRVLANTHAPDPKDRLPLSLLAVRDRLTYSLANLSPYLVTVASSPTAFELVPALGRLKGRLRAAEGALCELQNELAAAGYDLASMRKLEDEYTDGDGA